MPPRPPTFTQPELQQDQGSKRGSKADNHKQHRRGNRAIQIKPRDELVAHVQHEINIGSGLCGFTAAILDRALCECLVSLRAAMTAALKKNM